MKSIKFSIIYFYHKTIQFLIPWKIKYNLYTILDKYFLTPPQKKQSFTSHYHIFHNIQYQYTSHCKGKKIRIEFQSSSNQYHRKVKRNVQNIERKKVYSFAYSYFWSPFPASFSVITRKDDNNGTPCMDSCGYAGCAQREKSAGIGG